MGKAASRVGCLERIRTTIGPALGGPVSSVTEHAQSKSHVIQTLLQVTSYCWMAGRIRKNRNSCSSTLNTAVTTIGNVKCFYFCATITLSFLGRKANSGLHQLGILRSKQSTLRNTPCKKMGELTTLFQAKGTRCVPKK